MALSKPETTVEISNEDDGLEGICKSQSLYASILYSFRECHDLCVSSKLFSEEIIHRIDQCAVNFRQLSMDTVTVAKRVSNQWLNTTILFYRNIDSVKDPKKILLLLSGQARDLAKCFKVIAQWATKLCSKFHKAQNDTIEEAEEFKKKFTAAESQAESAKKIAEDELDSAKSLYSGAKETADKWKTAQVATSWIPIGFIVTSIGSSVAERKRLEASKLERQASERLHEAEEELKKRKSEKDKAEVIHNIILNYTV